MDLNGDLRLFNLTHNFLQFMQTVQTMIRHCTLFLLFNQTVQTLIRCHVLLCLIWVCTVCQCPSPGSTDPTDPCNTALRHHSDKNSAAINKGYLDFIQMYGLTSLVNDNHMDKNLKVVLVYVYFGMIVNNRPKKHIPTHSNESTKNKIKKSPTS